MRLQQWQEDKEQGYGHNGPKGTFKLDIIPNEKSLFEILAENLKKANYEYDITIPWYIMVSRENGKDTIDFFEKNSYFDYPKSSVKFFKQSELPLITEKGEFLIDENYKIKEAADGNGGIFASMRKAGIIDELKEKGIEWVFIGAVDNPLLNMSDEILLGVAIAQNTLIASKSVVKAFPEEPVGVFCMQNKKVKVIEYTELPKKFSTAVDENGELLFGEAHIMCNLFNTKALEKISNEKLIYHKAFKKATYMNLDGEIIKPENPNAYKFEAFIFDSFEFFNDISILRGKREDDFAPVKNATGNDSPETAKKLYNDFVLRNREKAEV